MDKRLYRMRQLHWALASSSRRATVEDRMKEYRDVLYDWNDTLHQNLAATNVHFGRPVYIRLESVYERFAQLGAELERTYRHMIHDEEIVKPLEQDDMDGRLTGLSYQIYDMNIQMLSQLQRGEVGRSAPSNVNANAGDSVPPSAPRLSPG
jgi:hypothetical protein